MCKEGGKMEPRAVTENVTHVGGDSHTALMWAEIATLLKGFLDRSESLLSSTFVSSQPESRRE